VRLPSASLLLSASPNSLRFDEFIQRLIPIQCPLQGAQRLKVIRDGWFKLNYDPVTSETCRYRWVPLQLRAMKVSQSQSQPLMRRPSRQLY
jgi:hypothetical protein